MDRAVRLLEILADIGDGRVTDLADKVEVHKSTASRLLATLEAHDLVEQDPVTGAFRLGHGIVRLAGGVHHAFDLGTVSRSACLALAREVRETVNLVVLDGVHTMCIDQVLGAAGVTTVNWLGKRSPTHVAASGKVLLAHLDPGVCDQHVATPLDGPTERSITDLDDLATDLATVGAWVGGLRRRTGGGPDLGRRPPAWSRRHRRGRDRGVRADVPTRWGPPGRGR